MNLLRFPHKQIRAAVIADHLRRAGRAAAGVVCFSCGNASAALRAAGLDVLDVGPRGALQPRHWWTEAEIAKAFPTMFDATSGHLSTALMLRIGQAYRAHLGELPPAVYVPSGSGETAVCLALAYPERRIHAVYDDSDPATTWNDAAPLNTLVERLCEVVRLVA